MVSTSPGWSANDTPLTAAAVPSRRTKRTVRSSTAMTGSGLMGLGGSAGTVRRLRPGQMAGGEMAERAVERRLERRRHLGAARLGEAAAGAEASARGRVDRVGRIAGQRLLGGAAVRIEGR